ncbi:putative uncharacterized transcriptional regulatory protein [Clavispora lusitaniae]|uniref:Uncharacterized transcriptional regulatory protein n=1 Tax=Clavispora lusitaniae TaxID=36911 RepID=A0ACD0WKQ7_CLALS|nr:hypothetical protein E0198_002791 [Clavispora lusitaniae]QFZ27898.1 putative uncharacterized transcriptional regulatory protein [Clavispora lusitaniae]QFZ32795.1 putative uncharacterized transcriptional regulatory protein [Clavispora lusitaniae]QFZ38465.1 putative uncharacterized transcriptional regulatory protein [Clavispora lusitaniae]QFZ44147.1 putative uncharacterized transcriptional regulatory protein [Clavispora lusitaniae]
MSEYPISCIPCRRRKVKCNKRKPCNRCFKNNLKCEFPSKFRNVEVHKDEDPSMDSISQTVSQGTHNDSHSPDVSKLSEEVTLLRREKLGILHENFRLIQKVRDLKNKLQKADRASNADCCSDGAFEISGETTELGEKYYGPSSSNYMIDVLRREKDNTPHSDDSSKKDDNIQEPDNHTEEDEPSQMKKKLPNVLRSRSSEEENRRVVIYLVNHFFNVSRYRSMISQPQMLNFVENYHLIKEDEWEHDDDLLLLHMMLILSVQRLTPKDYNESGISTEPIESVSTLNMRTNSLKKALYRGFSSLRHNLINESIVTVQAHILCIEWYFIDSLYEEAWSMMFHSCSIAYSIGLHVMFNLRTTSKNVDKATAGIAQMTKNDDDEEKTEEVSKDSDQKALSDDEEEEEEEDDDAYDISRFKVWFALKHVSGQLCSILGRPSPISIQVNSLVLMSSGMASLSKMGLALKETQVHLKMGLSECIRLSNVMLIESFMMNFTLENVVMLENQFKEEAKSLMWFASKEYRDTIRGNENELNQYSDIPIYVDRCEALGDLLALHVNRAKLLQPFMNQFVGVQENDYLFNSICECIYLYLDYILDFVKAFLQQNVPKYVGVDGKVVSKIRLGTAFRTQYPFINSFIYQGMIVIFTLLNYKAQDFIRGKAPQFLKDIKGKLNSIIDLDIQCHSLLEQNANLWSTNIVYLVNKNIQQAIQLYKRYEDFSENKSGNSESMPDNDIGSSSMVGFNMNDPFWITNPDNLPYYLSSPSDDEMQQVLNTMRDQSISTASYDQDHLPALWANAEQSNLASQSQPIVPPQQPIVQTQPMPTHPMPPHPMPPQSMPPQSMQSQSMQSQPILQPMQTSPIQHQSLSKHQPLLQRPVGQHQQAPHHQQAQHNLQQPQPLHPQAPNAASSGVQSTEPSSNSFGSMGLDSVPSQLTTMESNIDHYGVFPVPVQFKQGSGSSGSDLSYDQPMT